MTLIQRITALANAFGADIKALAARIVPNSVAISGDASGSGNFDANGNATVNVTLKGDPVNNKGTISGPVTLSYADGNYVVLKPSAATTLTLTGVPDNSRAYGLTFELQDAGTFLTFPGTITWIGGAPTFKTTGTNIVTLITRNGGTSWIGMAN